MYIKHNVINTLDKINKEVAIKFIDFFFLIFLEFKINVFNLIPFLNKISTRKTSGKIKIDETNPIKTFV